MSNVSGLVSVMRIPLWGHPALVRQRLVLRNHTRSAVQGPLYLVVQGLPKGVRLKNATGMIRAHSHSGDPYLLLPVKQFPPGQALTLDLLFANPHKVPIQCTTVVLAGPGLV
jgi:hypothetical protein